LERRRISLSLKQANEGVDIAADDFDPALYGMTASYDDAGNYIYPDGFDPETQEWKAGYEEQQRAWEHQYAEAQARWQAHKKQVEEAEAADVQAAVTEVNTAAYSAGGVDETAPEGSLASDEALQALREKLTGGR
jgi:small subunit ribosomal protein S1